MLIVTPSVKVLDDIDGMQLLKKIEVAGRTCYKSEECITEESCKKFVRSIIASGHHSVLEHVNISVKVICDRGVSHEIVRHRIASYSQESTRYCSYNKDKFGSQLCFVQPEFALDEEDLEMLRRIEEYYMKCITEKGRKAQQARYFLPNGLKTEIVMTMNLREWRHFFALRTSTAAHPQMREVAFIILNELSARIPVVFEEYLK